MRHEELVNGQITNRLDAHANSSHWMIDCCQKSRNRIFIFPYIIKVGLLGEFISTYIFIKVLLIKIIGVLRSV